MCARGRFASLHLPSGAVLLLLLCTLALGSHLLVEGMAAGNPPSVFDLLTHGDHSPLADDPCEEAFLLALPAGLPADPSSLPPESPRLAGGFSYFITPQLPPPNA